MATDQGVCTERPLGSVLSASTDSRPPGITGLIGNGSYRSVWNGSGRTLGPMTDDKGQCDDETPKLTDDEWQFILDAQQEDDDG